MSLYLSDLRLVLLTAAAAAPVLGPASGIVPAAGIVIGQACFHSGCHCTPFVDNFQNDSSCVLSHPNYHCCCSCVMPEMMRIILVHGQMCIV